jgi:hypothetical protein
MFLFGASGRALESYCTYHLSVESPVFTYLSGGGAIEEKPDPKSTVKDFGGDKAMTGIGRSIGP